MRALVVYESMFGNTQTIATAIAEGLSKHVRTELLEVGAAPFQVPEDVGLIVVGGPTHAFGMSRPGSRQSAAESGAVVSKGIGQREWIDGLELNPGHRVAVATYTTRIDRPRFFWGSAARSAKKHLARRGLEVLEAENFYVTGPRGPVALIEGERERAVAWGEKLALRVNAPAATTHATAA